MAAHDFVLHPSARPDEPLITDTIPAPLPTINLEEPVILMDSQPCSLEQLVMKSISASIVVLAGAIVLIGGSYVRHDQTQGVLQLLGSILGAVGLVVWFKTLKSSQQ